MVDIYALYHEIKSPRVSGGMKAGKPQGGKRVYVCWKRNKE